MHSNATQLIMSFTDLLNSSTSVEKLGAQQKRRVVPPLQYHLFRHCANRNYSVSVYTDSADGALRAQGYAYCTNGDGNRFQLESLCGKQRYTGIVTDAHNRYHQRLLCVVTQTRVFVDESESEWVDFLQYEHQDGRLRHVALRLSADGEVDTVDPQQLILLDVDDSADKTGVSPLDWPEYLIMPYYGPLTLEQQEIAAAVHAGSLAALQAEFGN
jgi:hypothetical protein